MRHKLIIGGEDWTANLMSASVAFRADAGSSGLDFSVRGSLEEYVNAPIAFSLGPDNDNLKTYFTGTLYTPNDDDKLDTSAAMGFGPFRTMVDQSLGSNETFVGKTLEWVIMECAQRSETMPGQIVVINGNTYRVQQGESFPFDNKIGDVLNTLIGKANFVGVDQPGGRRLFMPRPIPGSNTNFKREYTPKDYTEFSIDPTAEASYRKVIVYRNGSNGVPEIYAEREINSQLRFKPRRNSFYVVSDFAGSGQDAQNEAYRLAEELRNGQHKFSLSIPFDGDLSLFDGLRVVRSKRGNERTYACFIDDGMSIDYSPGSPARMSVDGMAYEIKRARRYVPITQKYFAYSGVVSEDKIGETVLKDSTLLTDASTLSGEPILEDSTVLTDEMIL